MIRIFPVQFPYLENSDSRVIDQNAHTQLNCDIISVFGRNQFIFIFLCVKSHQKKLVIEPITLG